MKELFDILLNLVESEVGDISALAFMLRVIAALWVIFSLGYIFFAPINKVDKFSLFSCLTSLFFAYLVFNHTEIVGLIFGIIIFIPIMLSHMQAIINWLKEPDLSDVFESFGIIFWICVFYFLVVLTVMQPLFGIVLIGMIIWRVTRFLKGY